MLVIEALYGKTKTNQLENPNQRQNQAWKIMHLPTNTPRVNSTWLPYTKMAILRTWGILAKTSKNTRSYPLGGAICVAFLKMILVPK